MLCCCNDRSQGSAAAPEGSTSDFGLHKSNRKLARSFGRAAALVQWALPVTTLVLIPKCPACVAAYVLLFTGVGLSFDVAAIVRWTLIVMSVAALAYLVLRFARRALAYRGSALSLAAPSATASLSAGDQEFRNRSAADSSKPSTGPATIR
jgi:hypothetical protein